MIIVICGRCHKELALPGGLAFSPPRGRMTEKIHLCVPCWESFIEWMEKAEAIEKEARL